MTTHKTPQQAAMERLEELLAKTTQLYRDASSIVDYAIHDAVNLPKSTRPFLLTDEGLAGLSRHRNALLELVTYYTNQKEQFTATLNAIAERNGGAQPSAPQEESAPEEEPQVETVDTLRVRIEKLAGGQDIIEQPAAEVIPVTHRTNRPDRTAVLEAAEKLVSENVKVVLPHEPGGLPAAMPVVELQPENAAALRPQENSIQRLLGANSPLLDLFCMGPWLHNGKGYITVGTEGFKWYKGTNPMDKSPAERASLPSGFYSGLDIPAFVVLRMDKCILIWSFKLDPTAMSVYMVGPSDADPNNIRWFSPIELTASHTRQLITELLAAVEKYKTSRIEA